MSGQPQLELTILISKETVDRVVGEFLSDLSIRNAPVGTLRGYRKELRGFLGWLTGSESSLLGEKFAVTSISDDHVRAYLAMLHEGCLNSATRAKALAVIRSWLNFLGRRHYIKENVALLVKRPRVHERATILPSADDVLDMLDSLPMIHLVWPARDIAMIVMLYCCMLLPSELVLLNVCDVDGRHNEIIVRGRKERRVQLGIGGAIALNEYLAERDALTAKARKRGRKSSALFINRTLNGIYTERRDARLSVGSLQKIVRAATGQFPPLAYVTSTTLRRAGAVHMFDGGAGLRSVADLLGLELRAADRLKKLSTTQVKQEVDRTHPRGRIQIARRCEGE